jgi:hypothetical protein
MNTHEYVYKTTLKTDYHLPDAWIAALGDPDKTIKNPHYRSRQSSLYLRARVESFIEARQDEYEALVSRRIHRSFKAKTSAEKRRQALLDWAMEVDVAIYKLPETWERLVEQAQAEFLGFQWDKGNYQCDFHPTKGAILAYVRHQHTNYHLLLSQIEGKPGCDDAYPLLKTRVNGEVEAVLKQRYPGRI